MDELCDDNHELILETQPPLVLMPPPRPPAAAAIVSATPTDYSSDDDDDDDDDDDPYLTQPPSLTNTVQYSADRPRFLDSVDQLVDNESKLI